MLREILRRICFILRLFKYSGERPFTITGRVVAERSSHRSIVGLRVEAWHEDRKDQNHKLIGSATTGEEGTFSITASAWHLKKLSIPTTPNVYFKVYDRDALIKTTEDTILLALKTGRTDIVIAVDFRIGPNLDETALVGELGFRLTGTPANGARFDSGKAAELARVIWVEDGDEVLVHLDSTQVRILDGVLLVSVDLETDQTGRQPLVVALGLGDDERAGLIAVTDELPHGNPVLAARWGRTLQTAVWSSLLGVVGDHAAEQNNSPLGIRSVKGTLRLETGEELKVSQL